MSLDTYANLQTEVANWLRRSDLTSTIPTFITMAEAEMNERLRVYSMLTRTTVSITAERIANPVTDFIEGRTFVVANTTRGPLSYVTPEDMAEAKAQGAVPTGEPRGYSLYGTTLEFYPAPDQTYSAALVYYARIPALSVSDTSNWVLANHPEAYLYGALKSSAPYLKADDRVPMWEAKFSGAIKGINRSHQPVKDALARTDVPRTRRTGLFNILTGY